MEDDFLSKSENVNVESNIYVVEGETVLGDDIIALEEGMKFKNQKVVFDFYKGYAYNLSFLTRKRNSKKDDTGVLRYVTFTCNREGQRSSRIN